MAQKSQASVVAVTGGIGSGKSAVVVALCEISGARGISADNICRQLLEPEAIGWQALRQKYGEKFFKPDQSVDRPLLRRVLFEDQNFRHELNILLHPLVRREIALAIGQEAASGLQGRQRFVVEVPLLYEARWEGDFSPVVVVYAEEKTCLRRLTLRDRLSEAEAGKAISSQMPLESKALLADYVIDNNGPWTYACLQILHLRNLLWPDNE